LEYEDGFLRMQAQAENTGEEVFIRDAWASTYCWAGVGAAGAGSGQYKNKPGAKAEGADVTRVKQAARVG